VEMSDELRESADKLVELLAELLKGI